MTRTDQELVELTLSGDIRCFDELLRRYRPKLLRFIYPYVRDKERAEDLAQEVFLRVYRNLHRFDLDRKFSSWLYRITANICRNELRRVSRRPVLVSNWIESGSRKIYERAPAIGDDGDRPDVRLERKELKEAMFQVMHKLPKKYREVFILREVEGLSYEEISEIVDCPVGTIKSRVNRGRLKFRSLLEKYSE